MRTLIEECLNTSPPSAIAPPISSATHELFYSFSIRRHGQVSPSLLLIAGQPHFVQRVQQGMRKQAVLGVQGHEFVLLGSCLHVAWKLAGTQHSTHPLSSRHLVCICVRVRVYSRACVCVSMCICVCYCSLCSDGLSQLVCRLLMEHGREEYARRI